MLSYRQSVSTSSILSIAPLFCPFFCAPLLIHTFRVISYVASIVMICSSLSRRKLCYYKQSEAPNMREREQSDVEVRCSPLFQDQDIILDQMLYHP